MRSLTKSEQIFPSTNTRQTRGCGQGRPRAAAPVSPCCAACVPARPRDELALHRAPRAPELHHEMTSSTSSGARASTSSMCVCARAHLRSCARSGAAPRDHGVYITPELARARAPCVCVRARISGAVRAAELHHDITSSTSSGARASTSSMCVCAPAHLRTCARAHLRSAHFRASPERASPRASPERACGAECSVLARSLLGADIQ